MKKGVKALLIIGAMVVGLSLVGFAFDFSLMADPGGGKPPGSITG